MSPSTHLKMGSMSFAMFWTAWMLWSSGTTSVAQIVILLPCGAGVGYGWYRWMRWFLARDRVPTRPS